MCRFFADDCIFADKKGRNHADPFGHYVFDAKLLKKHLEHELRNCNALQSPTPNANAPQLTAVRQAILGEYKFTSKQIKRSAVQSFLRGKGIAIRTATLGRLLSEMSAAGEIRYQTRRPRKTKG